MHRRNVIISCFVSVWILLFHYQTFRVKYLNPWTQTTFGITLPKIPLLFPPAGWIMFYRIGRSDGSAEVYGFRDTIPEQIDPHDILETKALGYDNIHRNVLVGVLYRERARDFCRFLVWKFPEYSAFAVVYVQHPDVIDRPDEIQRSIAYRCQ